MLQVLSLQKEKAYIKILNRTVKVGSYNVSIRVGYFAVMWQIWTD